VALPTSIRRGHAFPVLPDQCGRGDRNAGRFLVESGAQMVKIEATAVISTQFEPSVTPESP
jgi:hypothetical protein